MAKLSNSSRSEKPMRHMMGNFWSLIRGRSLAAIMAFFATALMARTLGPTQFGMVILIHSYAMLIRALLDFDSVDAMVKFGLPAHDAGDNEVLAGLIKLCRRIDKQSSFAAMILALLIAPFAGPTMGMDKQHILLLMAYSMVLITTGTGTASGILRLHNRFDILGLQMTIAPTIRFIGVVISWWLGAPIEIFVAIWGSAYAAENCFLLWQAKLQYESEINQISTRTNLDNPKLGDFVGLKKFLWATYWQSNIDILPKHLSTLFVGYLLGPAEAGLLRLARELSSTLAKPAVLIRQVIFVDLTRHWHSTSDAFNLVTYRTSLLGGALGIFVVLTNLIFGDYLLANLLGPQFINAKNVLTLMLLAATIDLAASPLRSALYAMGFATKTLHVHIFSTAIYITLFVLMTWQLGLIGAGIAASYASTITFTGMIILLHKNNQSMK